MKMTYAGRVPAAPLTPAAVHRALSHLMDHKAHADMYLAMTPAGKMDWFNSFPTKYYLCGAGALDAYYRACSAADDEHHIQVYIGSR
jgi:hypothetical protein